MLIAMLGVCSKEELDDEEEIEEAEEISPEEMELSGSYFLSLNLTMC